MTVIYQLIYAVPDPFSGDRLTLGAWVRTPPLQTHDIQTRVLVTGKPPPLECFESHATGSIAHSLHARLQSVRPAWDSLRSLSPMLHFGEEVPLDLEWDEAVRMVASYLPRHQVEEGPSVKPNGAGQPHWADAVADIVDPEAWVFEAESADTWEALGRSGLHQWLISGYFVELQYAPKRAGFVEVEIGVEDLSAECATSEAVSLRMRRLIAAAEAYSAVEAP